MEREGTEGRCEEDVECSERPTIKDDPRGFRESIFIVLLEEGALEASERRSGSNSGLQPAVAHWLCVSGQVTCRSPGLSVLVRNMGTKWYLPRGVLRPQAPGPQ